MFSMKNVGITALLMLFACGMAYVNRDMPVTSVCDVIVACR